MSPCPHKKSTRNKLLERWVSLTGESLDPVAGLQVSVSPLAPPIQAQPKVGELIELYDRGVITRGELRHQLTLATAQSLSSPSLQMPLAGPTLAASPDSTQPGDDASASAETSSPARSRRRGQQGA